ncbi:hypothetical protein [Dermabacter sp. Marseille-Q3180]|uniref:SWIM zinc finger family protein n=1 Tax=Dermabacter sp. Marseille-Q3180 TaxID=2758090 RepID=UPI00202520DB|nr:hypothetical protein [Dermabacter sp. Marseille-Q3180]
MSIEMTSKRGAIGESFLATEFLARAEVQLGRTRLAAGRRLARAGAVEWLDVTDGHVKGEVTAAIDSTLTHPQLDFGPRGSRDIEALSARARRDPHEILAVLAGTYDIADERELEKEGLALLPSAELPLSFGCTCLRWPDVCEHVWALALAFTEHIDRAPADYLALLGLDVEKLHLTEGDSDGAPATVGPEPHVETRTRFDPARLESEILVRAMGEEAAALFAAFYAEAEREGDAPPKDVPPTDTKGRGPGDGSRTDKRDD